MISDSVRQIRERSVAWVDSDGGAMLKHLAEAIDLRLHALQFSLVRGAVQHRAMPLAHRRERHAPGPPAVHPVAHRRSAGHPGAAPAPRGWRRYLQAAQPLLYALVGLLQLLILRKRLRRRLYHVQPGEVRQRPGVVFHLVGEGIKDLALLYRLAFDAVGAGGHEHSAPGSQRQANGDPVSPVSDGGDSHREFPCMQMKLF